MQTTSPSQIFGFRFEAPLIVAVSVHILLWSFGPALVLGNLHTDTLEAAYWGHDWALGYSKHPPLTSWLIDAVLQIGHAPLFSLMALSQATLLITLIFIWHSIRLYASRQTASMAVMLYCLTPAANIYAVQLNHNSMLAPFCAATLYFGLAYLEEGRWRDALALGVSVGLGAITKYEIAFAVIPLLVLTMSVPRFRLAFSNIKSYVAVLISLLIFAPHLWWLHTHHWSSFARAIGVQKIDSIDSFNLSVVNALIGAVALLAVPSCLLLATQKWRALDDDYKRPDRELIAFVVLVIPIFSLVMMSFATWQVIKPLWVLPLTTSTIIGLALFFPAGAFGVGLTDTRASRLILIFTSTAFAGFVAYLTIAAAIGKPLTAYSAQTETMNQQAIRFWQRYSKTPLACVIINERKIGPALALWQYGKPLILDISSPDQANIAVDQACETNGALAALVEPLDDPRLLAAFPSACAAQAQEVIIEPKYVPHKAIWRAKLIYIPPRASHECVPLAAPEAR